MMDSITVRAKDFSDCRHILIKYYDKVSKHIIRRPDSNFFDCYELCDIIPKSNDIDYLRVKKILDSKLIKNGKDKASQSI